MFRHQRHSGCGAGPIAVVATGLMLLAGCAQMSSVQPAIERILAEQAAAWNRGDIDGFMAHYWNSDQLTFSAAGQTQRGWRATRDRYRERYPTAERMGRLMFDSLESRWLGGSGDAVLVLGRWHLEREPDPMGGNFTLILEKIDGRWVITHDHTSIGQ